MANKPPLTVRSVSKGLKTAAQMIADNTRDVVSEVMPNMSGTWFSMQREATSTVTKALAQTNANMSRHHSLISRTKLGRNAQIAINSMSQRLGLADYEGRQLSFELENFSEDFDDDSFSEGADGKESFETGYGTSESMKAYAAMNRNIAASGLATVRSMNNMTSTLAHTQVESTKALTSTIENMSIAQTNAISGGLSEVVRQIQITNNYTAAMLEFMNQNISPSNSNMVDTMSVIGAKLDEISNSIKNTNQSIAKTYEREESKMDKIFSDGAGFDAKAYKKMIKESLDETGLGQTIGMLTSTLAAFTGSVKQNGVIKGGAQSLLPIVSKSIVRAGIGTNTKNRLMQADRKMSEAIQSFLFQLGDMEEDINANNFQKFLGKVLGVKRPKLGTINMGGGRKDEVMGWNGVAQTALTQVIPNYLASIEKALNGNKERKLYDYDAGVFKTQSEVMNDMVTKIIQMNDDSFGVSATRIVEALERNGADQVTVNELMKTVNSLINDRINNGRGADKLYKHDMTSALTNAGLGEVDTGRIMSSLEHDINSMTVALSEFNAKISGEATETLAYRNILNNFDDISKRMAEQFMSASKTFINQTMFNAMAENELYEEDIYDKIGDRVYNAISKSERSYLDETKDVFESIGIFAQGMSNYMYGQFVPKENRGKSASANAQKRQAYEAQINNTSATSQADKFNESNNGEVPSMFLSKPNKPMSDGQNKSANAKIVEAISSGDSTSILQGLVMSLQNNLLVPMYSNFFSERGIINKFFGEDPNSEWNKLKEKLFGKEDGILTPMVDYLKYQFTGKGYVSRSGKVYEDKEESIWGNIKELYGKGYDYSMNYLLGDSYTETETYQKFFHHLSPEGIAANKKRIDEYKKRVRLEAKYIAKFRDLRDRVMAGEITGKEYMKEVGSLDIDSKGEPKGTGLFNDLITNIDDPATQKRILDRVSKYNKDLQEGGFFGNGEYEKLGEGRRRFNRLGYGQHDPRWAMMPTGYTSDGMLGTMGMMGCGFTALSDIGGMLGRRINPAQALRFAQSNGFVTEGGANEGLYTKGARMLGFNSKDVSRSTALNALRHGNPAIFAGKGYGSGSIFSPQGHIVSAYNADNRSVTIMDPETGRPRNYPLSILNGVKKAFTFDSSTKSKYRMLGRGKEAQAFDEPVMPEEEKDVNVKSFSKILVDAVRWDSKDSIFAKINENLVNLIKLGKLTYRGLFGEDVNAELNGPKLANNNPINIINANRNNTNANVITINTPGNNEPVVMGVHNANITFDDETLSRIESALDTKSLGSSAQPTATPLDREALKAQIKEKSKQLAEAAQNATAESAAESTLAQESNNLLEEVANQNKEFQEKRERAEKDIADYRTSLDNLNKITNEAVGDPKDFKAQFLNGLKKYEQKYKKLPSAITKGALIGGTIGALNMSGAGLLTSLFLPTSLTGGAIAGVGLSLLARSEKFKEFLFGKKDEDGRVTGGLISKQQAATFKKALPFAVGGATVGIVKNIIGGALGMGIGAPGVLTGALLGTNPIGAGIVGLGLGILNSNDKFKAMLFGKKDTDGKHSGGMLSKAIDKMTDVVEGAKGFGKSGLKGAGIGLLAGATLSNMGYLPAALSLGGPIGAAVAGLGIGIASNTDRFKRYLFGDEYIDSEGKSQRKKNGLVHRAFNKIMNEAVTPIANQFHDSMMDLSFWARKHLVLPFKLAFGPLIDTFSTFKDDLKKTVKDAFNKIGDSITNILKGGLETLLSPLTTAINKIGTGSIKLLTTGVKMAGALPSAMLHMGALRTHRKRRKTDLSYQNAVFDKIDQKHKLDDMSGKYNRFGGSLLRFIDHSKDFLGMGDFADDDLNVAMRDAYGDELKKGGLNHLGWFSAKAEFRRDKHQYKADQKKRDSFRAAEKLLTKWMKEDRYIEDRGWTDELVDERAKALRQHGLLKEGVNSEEVIKQLMYHRSDWKARFGEFGTENLEIKEKQAKEEEAREGTKNYQNDMLKIANELLDVARGRGAVDTAEILTERQTGRSRGRNTSYYKRFGLTDKDVKNIEEFTQGRIDFSKTTVQRFKERAKDDPNFVMSKEDHDYIYADHIASGEMQDWDTMTSEKERKSKINNLPFIASLHLKGFLSKRVYEEMADEYSTADISHDELTKIGVDKMINSVLTRVNSKDHSLNISGENIDVNGEMDALFNDGFINTRISSLAKAEVETHDKVKLEDYESFLTDIIKNAMVDAEEIIEEENVQEAKERRETEEATKGTSREADFTPKGMWEKFFTKKDGSLNLAGKGVEKVKKSWIGKLFSGLGSFGSAVAGSPLLQMGLGIGAFLFKDQISDGVKTIAAGIKSVGEVYIPQFTGWLKTTAFPWIMGQVSSVAEYAIKTLPEIAKGVLRGAKSLWTDFVQWAGFDSRSTSYSADQVDKATGMTNDGKSVARWLNPETGEYEYIYDKDGNYQVLGDYQYISNSGEIKDMNRGSGYNLARYGLRGMRNTKYFAGGAQVVGGTIKYGSKFLKHIPLINKVPGYKQLFGATEFIGDKLGKAGSAFSKSIKASAEAGVKAPSVLQMVGSKSGTLAQTVNESILNKRTLGAQKEVDKILASISKDITKSYELEDIADVTKRGEINAKYADEFNKSFQKLRDSKAYAKAGVDLDAMQKTGISKLSGSLDELGQAATESLAKVDNKKGVLKWLGDMITGIKNFFRSKKKSLNQLVHENLFTRLIDKLVAWGDDFAKSASDKILAKFASSCASGFMKAVDDWIPVLNVGLTVYDAWKGFTNASILFGVPAGEEDGTMKVISTIMNTILGLGVGPIFDIFLTMYSSVTGRNMKQELAVTMYEMIMEISGNSDAIKDLKNSQKILEEELAAYNLDHAGEELSMQEYLTLTENERSFWNKVKKNFGMDHIDLSKYRNYETKNNSSRTNFDDVMDSAASRYNNRYNSSSNTSSDVSGYGSAIGYGFSQRDPRWAKYTLGKFPNGKTATMDLAGCGPTALANVASQMSIPVSPSSVARMAVNNGYISEGGANAGLFNEGVNKLGLSSVKIGPSEIVRHLQNGEKIIVSGKSVGYGSLFTPAGHIISIDGIDGNKVYVTDPDSGQRYTTSLSNITPEMTHAWAIRRSLGYGYGGVSSFTESNINDSIRLVNLLREYEYDKFKSLSWDEQVNLLYKYNGQYMGLNKDTYSESMFVSDDMQQLKMLDTYSKTGIRKYSESEINNIRLQKNDLYSYIMDDLKKWWDSCSENQKNNLYGEWCTSHFNSEDIFKGQGWFVPSLKKIMKKHYGSSDDPEAIREVIKVLYEFELMTEIARNRGVTDKELMNLYLHHGFFNISDTSTKLSSNSEKTETKKILQNAEVSSVIAAVMADPTNPAVYSNLSYQTIRNLSDAKYGGNPDLMDNWFYRALYTFIEQSGGKANQSVTKDFLDRLAYFGFDSKFVDSQTKKAYGDFSPIDGRPYGIMGGIPLYSISDPLWQALKWRNGTFGTNGSEIAALASILTAYNVYNGNATAITPSHMLTNWFIPKNSAWYDETGIKDNFYTKIGLQALQETFTGNGMPLKITTSTNFNDIISAMKERKLVLLSNTGSTNNKLFGNSPYIVGTYSDGEFVSAVDPTHPNNTSIPILSVKELPSHGFKARIFETGDGSGINIEETGNVNTPNFGSSIWSKIKEESSDDLGVLGKIFKAFAAMGSNLLTGFINTFNGDSFNYESIFTEKMDATNSGVVADSTIAQYDYLNEATKYEEKRQEELSNPNAHKSSGQFMSTINSMSATNLKNIIESGGVYNGWLLNDNEYGRALELYKKNQSGTVAYDSSNISYETKAPVLEMSEDRKKVNESIIKYSYTLDPAAQVGAQLGLKLGNYLAGYGRGGEDDTVYDLSTVDGILGKFTAIVGGHVNSSITGKEFDYNTLSNVTAPYSPEAAANRNVSDSDIAWGDGYTAAQLPVFAKSMKAVGCRYVWGANCQKITRSLMNTLKNRFGNNHDNDPNHYDNMLARYGGGYGSDCSGLIRGFTGNTGLNAQGLYNSSTEKGRISSMPSDYWYKAGVLVFRQNSEGNIVHVGIVVGDGATVIDTGKHLPNASSDIRINHYSSGGWTHYGLSKYLNYNPKASEATGLGRGYAEFSRRTGYGTGGEVDYLLGTLGGRITQTVGYGVDPITGAITRHRGTDIAALKNSLIHSPVSGTVVENKSVGYGSDYGNYVVVRDGSGKKHLIAHMNSASGYGVGSHVNRGDVLGRVGSTGRSTGPHVHYEVREKGQIIDPMSDNKYSLGLKKSNLKIMESKLDAAMKKNGSSVGGDDDVIATLTNAIAGTDRADHIIESLQDIIAILTGWSNMDAESKDRILDAMDNVGNGSNVNINNNNVVKESKPVTTKPSSGANTSIVSPGGRSLHDILAKK